MSCDIDEGLDVFGVGPSWEEVLGGPDGVVRGLGALYVLYVPRDTPKTVVVKSPDRIRRTETTGSRSGGR